MGNHGTDPLLIGDMVRSNSGEARKAAAGLPVLPRSPFINSRHPPWRESKSLRNTQSCVISIVFWRCLCWRFSRRRTQPKRTDKTRPFTVNTYLRLPRPDGGEAHVAGPHVIKVDGTWSLYGTHTGRDPETCSSRNLRDWKYEGVIGSPTPDSWNTRDVWASQVEQTDEGFYL